MPALTSDEKSVESIIVKYLGRIGGGFRQNQEALDGVAANLAAARKSIAAGDLELVKIQQMLDAHRRRKAHRASRPRT